MVDQNVIMIRMHLYLALGWTALALCIPLPSAHAQDASAWSDDMKSSMRLIAGSNEGSPVLRAGVEIKLQAGWKTYWRYPGDSGVPPQFDFSGSDNVGDVSVRWPAPHRFTDESGTSIGYKERVVFPLRVQPRDPSKPVTLRLDLKYAVCEKLCVPAEGKSALSLPGAKSAHDAAIALAEAAVPSPAKLGDDAPLAVRVVKRAAGSPRPTVYVEVAAPAGSNPELFAEGPSHEWALPVPKAAPGAPPGMAHFGFELDGLPPGVDPNGKDLVLTLTLVAGGKAIEVGAPLR